ncbi:hypothetical protein [Nostoc sp. UHCC 0870]|uniref:hypothetical protein n=1 Tax=Nostoc sp. UHCC 0870 TaxID=2914041 RepID=UPI001EDEE1E3|nr:hypothetical protein [Nostoc sp. UHCC 0870]UKP00253.1 hypothetical protein L6494_11370 [Nostoc sp. UHCC 0870]
MNSEQLLFTVYWRPHIDKIFVNGDRLDHRIKKYFDEVRNTYSVVTVYPVLD